MRYYLSGPMAGQPDHGRALFAHAAAKLADWAYREHHTLVNPYDLSQAAWQREYATRAVPLRSLEAFLTTRERTQALRQDLGELLTCGGVILLPGWYRSRGATLEALVAQQIGLPLYFYNPSGAFTEPTVAIVYSLTHLAHMHAVAEASVNALTKDDLTPVSHVGAQTGVPKGDPAESIAAEADRLVDGDRQAAYGHPLDNFAFIAALWADYLAGRGLLKHVALTDDGSQGELAPRESVTAEDAALMMILVKIAREAHAPKRDNRVDLAGYAKVLDLIHAERAKRAGAPRGQ